jgi:NAD(P)H-flavin reductase
MATLPTAEAPFGPPRVVTVKARRRETRDTVSLDFEDPLATYAPGQFNMLYAFGKGEVPISISSVDGQRVTHTVRDVGLVTKALTELRAGSVMGVRGPFGQGWPVEASRGRNVVIVAGGLGLAPLRPAVETVLRNRDDYQRIVILYGARTPGDLMFVRELERWRGRFDIDVHVTVDAAPRGWRGEVGVVTKLFKRIAVEPDFSTAMVCGPEVMMRFAATGLIDVGINADDIWLSMERNMQCGAGVCGHCQMGPFLICRDGPVLQLSRLAPLMQVKEL